MKRLASVVGLSVCLVLLFVLFTPEKEKERTPPLLTRSSPNDLELQLAETDEPLSIYELTNEKSSIESLQSYDFVLLNDQTATELKPIANQLLSLGKVLYYAYPQVSTEEIASELALTKQGISSTNPYEKQAVVIYQINDRVIFTDIYQVSTGNQMDISANALLQGGMLSALKHVQRHKGLNQLRRADLPQSSNEQVTNMAAMLHKGTPIIDSKVLNIYNSQQIEGSLTVTHVIQQNGQWQVNDTMQEVWDTVGFVELEPSFDRAIDEYTMRMHANIAGHKTLEYTSLPVNAALTPYYVSIGTSTSAVDSPWMFQPQGQVYMTTMGDDSTQVRDYHAKASHKKKGEPRVTLAGMRVASGNLLGQRGSFTQLTFPLKDSKWLIEAGIWF